jgi:hypothetical protein
MKSVFTIGIVMITVFLFSSCYYDKEQLLYGNTVNCDTSTSFSYSLNVVPLLQQNCYGCHSGSFPSGNIRMGTYALDKVLGQNGTLYGSINHASGFSPMPKGTSKMTACQIVTIKKWIDGGMLNN